MKTLLILVLVVEILFVLTQFVGFVAWKMTNRHWKKYHNFDTFWFYVDNFFEPICIW